MSACFLCYFKVETNEESFSQVHLQHSKNSWNTTALVTANRLSLRYVITFTQRKSYTHLLQMKAPKKLDVVHGSGKIPYPQTRVKAADFSLNRGSEYLRIYHAYNDNEVPPSTLAYSFCSECAVHIVNASDTDTNEVSVNINCLHLIRQQEENYDNVEEELDELCSLPSPSSPACRDRAPSMIDVDRSSPVSNITQPAPFKMSSINEVGDSWVLRDPSRPSHLQVDTVAPLNLATKMPSSRASSGDWPTESESNSVYSSSYISRSTFDLGSLDGSVVDAFGDADTASRQEMLRSMRKYLKTSGSRKASSSSLTSTGTVPPRPPVSLPS